MGGRTRVTSLLETARSSSPTQEDDRRVSTGSHCHPPVGPIRHPPRPPVSVYEVTTGPVDGTGEPTKDPLSGDSRGGRPLHVDRIGASGHGHFVPGVPTDTERTGTFGRTFDPSSTQPIYRWVGYRRGLALHGWVVSVLGIPLPTRTLGAVP